MQPILFSIGIGVLLLGGIGSTYCTIKQYSVGGSEQKRLWLRRRRVLWAAAVFGLGVVFLAFIPRLGLLAVGGFVVFVLVAVRHAGELLANQAQ